MTVKFDKRKFFFSAFVIIMAARTFTNDKTYGRRQLQQNPENIIENHPEQPHNYTPFQMEFWLCLLAAATLIFMAAVCSGMTVGYLSIDGLQLEIYKDEGTPEQKRQANIILPIIFKHHQLLCTLLIGNAFCMEALPIFFDKVVPPALAIIISVIFIIFAGEILPQALCTGPRQLEIAERLTPLVKIIMILLWPIAAPLAWMLDKYFGEHSSTRFQKNELKALIELHAKGHGNTQGFTQAEINMITSTIDLKDKKVTQLMIPTQDIYSINKYSAVNKELMTRIGNSGFSYIPIYDETKDNIVGTIKSKTLIDLDLTNETQLNELKIDRPALFVTSDTSLLEMLMVFKQKKTKIAFVLEGQQQLINTSFKSLQIYDDRKGNKILGLISLKQLFQEIVKKEFQDQDNHIRLVSNSHATAQKHYVRDLTEPEEK